MVTVTDTQSPELQLPVNHFDHSPTTFWMQTKLNCGDHLLWWCLDSQKVNCSSLNFRIDYRYLRQSYSDTQINSWRTYNNWVCLLVLKAVGQLLALYCYYLHFRSQAPAPGKSEGSCAPPYLHSRGDCCSLSKSDCARSNRFIQYCNVVDHWPQCVWSLLPRAANDTHDDKQS